MRSNTSTEFLESIAFLHKLQWEEQTRTEHYLAQVAAEIRRVREMFSEKPQQVSISDYLLTFTADSEKKEETPTQPVPKTINTAGRKMIETGPEAVKDPKWAKVNEEAKSIWAARLGSLYRG